MASEAERVELMQMKEAKQLAATEAKLQQGFAAAAETWGMSSSDFVDMLHKIACNPKMETALQVQLGLYKAHGYHERPRD